MADTQQIEPQATQPQPEEMVKVWTSSGERGMVARSNLDAAIAAGAREATPEEIRKYEVEKKYGGVVGGLEAFGLGAARGLTFGASDWAARGLGMEKETLAGLKEAHPVASISGEITGAAAPLLLTMGASAPASGAAVAAEGAEVAIEAANAARVAKGATAVAKAMRTIGIAPRLVAEAGTATERAIYAGVASMAEGASKQALVRAITKVGAKGVAGALEGAIYGGGQMVSEAALGREDLNAEKIIAHIGSSALLGGEVGGAMGVAAETLPYVLRSASAALRKTQQATMKAADAITDTAGATVNKVTDTLAKGVPTLADDVAERAAQEVAEATSGTGVAAQELSAKEVRQAILDIPKKGASAVEIERSPLLREIKVSLKDSIKENKAIINAFESGPRRAEIKSLISAADPRTALDSAIEASGQFKTQLDDMISTNLREIEEVGEGTFSARLLKKARLVQKHLDDRLQEATTADEIWDAVDQARKEYGAHFGKKLRSNWQVMNTAERETYHALQDAFKPIRENLESVDIWGEAGSRHAQINRAYTEAIEADAELFEEVGRGRIGRRGGKKVSVTKLNRVLNQVGTERSSDAIDIINNRNNAWQRFYDLIDESDLTRGTVDLSQARSLLGRNVASLDRGAQAYGKINELRAIEGAYAWLSMGSGEGGILGTVAKAVSASMQPTTWIKGLARVERILSSIDGKTTSIIDGMQATSKELIEATHGATATLGGKIEEVGRAVTGLSRRSSRAATAIMEASQKAAAIGERAAEKIGETRGGISHAAIPASIFSSGRLSPDGSVTHGPDDSDFQKRTNELAYWRSDLNNLISHLTQKTSALSTAAPNTAANVQRVLTNIVNHLYDTGPKPPVYGDMLVQTTPKKWQASATEQRRWASRMYSALRPMDTFKDIINGTATPEAVDTLKTLFPNMFQQFSLQIANKIAKDADSIPRDKRIRISATLGIPLDPSMRPAAVRYVQSMVSRPPEQQAPGGGSGVSGAKNLETADRMQTSSERTLSR